MIKTINISNFQSHKDTTLELNPGVNIITGQSDSGKTSILRALRWLVTNRPSGDSFRSKWGGDTEVLVELENGNIVSRCKGKGKNDYQLNGNTFAAMGTDVPEQILSSLNISELNWQLQMDAPFLLSSSPGEVARVLNEVADLDKIDSSLFNINRMIRENRANLLSKGQEALRLESELGQYANVDELLRRSSKLKELDRKAKLIEEMVERGEGMINEIDVLQKALNQFKDTESAEEMIEGLMDVIGREQEYKSQVFNADNALRTLELKQKLLKDKIDELAKLEAQWLTDFPSVCPLCGK